MANSHSSADRRLILEFTKMHGAGNDFVVVDNRFYNFSAQELSDLAIRLCRRHFGIGADGILAFARPDDPENHYRMIYYNADGSRGSMCGNGARCLVRFAVEAGIDEASLRFESDAGIYRAQVHPDNPNVIRLFVQPPVDFRSDLTLETPVPSEFSRPYYIWPGVEHVVLFVDDLEAAPVAEIGRTIRRDPKLAPSGANVNFVAIESTGEMSWIRVRTYEKGVESETLACGTGAMASALVARLTDRISSAPVRVEMPGGRLDVGFSYHEGQINDLSLSGPVETVFRGTTYL